ncbi:hypothetical protein GLOIN_2v1783666 [Rhizophagus irregularis DAOM 181602=DAOM 197198]|nr:hypothetical protein GLOIN_2v1783666 [Rhizophagus irregularis DAOM 181602=DAOM 197198]
MTSVRPVKQTKVKQQSENNSRNHNIGFKLSFNHNHPINSFHSLSFRSVSSSTKLLYNSLFEKGYNAASAYRYFKFQLELKLKDVVDEYNQSKKGIAKLIPYDSNTNQAFILIVVTQLMLRIHQYVQQAGEICYIDAGPHLLIR